MSSISSLSSLLLTQSLMTENQNQLNKLSTQLASGVQSISLEGYGTNASQVLNLQSGLIQQQAYVTNNTQVTTVLNAYDTTLGQLQKDATTLQAGLQAFQTSNTTAISGASLTALLKGLNIEIGATLNTQVGDRYLYSGTRYSTAPVDLTQLTALTTPTAFSAVTVTSTPNNLPAYDAGAPNDPTGQAYAQQKVAIGDKQTISFGVNSNDPTIQKLIYALQSVQAGQASTGTTQAQFFANANSALSDVVSGLTTLQTTNAQNQVTVNDTTKAQQATISSLKTQQASLESIDTATVASQITALQNQLNGTYKVTATLLNLSLLNYLK